VISGPWSASTQAGPNYWEDERDDFTERKALLFQLVKSLQKKKAIEKQKGDGGILRERPAQVTEKKLRGVKDCEGSIKKSIEPGSWN